MKHELRAVLMLRLVRPCETPECEAEGTCEILDGGKHRAWHCRECIDIIMNIVSSTARMVDLGTPRDIAVHWSKG